MIMLYCYHITGTFENADVSSSAGYKEGRTPGNAGNRRERTHALLMDFLCTFPDLLRNVALSR